MSDVAADRIRELSDAVGEGDAIDWDLELLHAQDHDDSRVIRNLQFIAQVAAANEACASDVPENVPFAKWGHLRLKARLGSGSQGEVFLGEDERLGHAVALKILKSDSDDFVIRNHILEEARRLAQIRHENVVRVLGADIDHGRIGFWMEYVRGQNLASLLKLQGPMSATEATVYGVVLSRALGAAHSALVVHGDVKPTNVIREVGGRICLVDFGAGLSSRASRSSDRSTVRGTLLFMAPETLLEGRLDPRSDIYSLGALLFHLVTHRYPVEGVDREAIVAAHRQRTRLDLGTVRSDLPIRFQRVVERCLHHNPQERFQNAKALEAALDEAVKPSGRSSNRRVAVVVGIGLLGVLLGIGMTRILASPEAQVLEARGFNEATISVAAASQNRIATIHGSGEVLAYVNGTMTLTIHGSGDPCPPVKVLRPAGEPSSMLLAQASCQDHIAAGEIRQYRVVVAVERSSERNTVLRVTLRQ